MSYETIKVELRGSFAHIKLNRPKQRNAVNETLANEFRAALESVSADEAIRAVVISGEGNAFCAGADVSQFGNELTPAEVETYLLEKYKPIISAITSMPKPVIAAVHGPAAGAGMSIALACDFRVMSDEAAIYPAFIKIGLVPDAGATWFLARQIGYSRALEFLIDGRAMPAERCLALGMANRVVRPDQLAAEAEKWARELAERPTYAIALTKQALAFACDNDLMASFDTEARYQKLAIATEDHQAGIEAFKNRTTPVYKGR
ncbi:MAG: enoyl-CoA hydratase-related protein [bacterium]